MSVGLAIFVKTPGHSVVKGRLAATLGADAARDWYLHAADAVASVARDAQAAGDVVAYWAVAEADPDAVAAWTGLPVLGQGDGGLGARMAHVHAQLLQRHGAGMLVGADAPQLDATRLSRAAAWLRDVAPRAVLGPAADGGFWLYGANRAAPVATWESVRYSAADTAARFRVALAGDGEWTTLDTLTDADVEADLVPVAAALAALPAPTAAQARLLAWMLKRADGSGGGIGLDCSGDRRRELPTRVIASRAARAESTCAPAHGRPT